MAVRKQANGDSVQYGYDDQSRVTGQAYGNGDAVSFTYDILGRAKTTTYSDGRVLTYTYTGDGQLYRVTDSKTGYAYTYDYDSLGRLNTSTVRDSSGTVLLETRQVYNANNQLTAQQWTIGGTTYSQTFNYSKTTGALSFMTPGNGDSIVLTYDALQRLSTVTGSIYGKTYTYRDISSTQTTTQVAGLTYDFPEAITYGYTYDQFGNIATYTENGVTYTYTYSDDSQHQLLSQTGGGKTYTYTYDGVGNIRSASDGTTTHTYTYGDAVWKDLLTKFDNQDITYDGSGNPTSYYNGTRWGFEWEEGRNLVKATSGSNEYTYAYDQNGIRTQKTVNGVTHNYLYASGKLLRETWGTNTLDFFYDESGHPYALKYNGTTYYYVTNLQGDVLHIVNGFGTPVVSYAYDPYGKPTITSDTSDISLGTINPLRYRGYVYDSETGFYYLQSRYYDPAICRFINADSYVSTGQGILGCNMFAYCGNNPMKYSDYAGFYPLQVAFDFLDTWLNGDGEDQHYSEGSRIVKQLKKSKKMQSFIDSAIDKYIAGQTAPTTKTGEFTSEEDGYELYLSTQQFDYTITVVKETRTVGIWWWKHEEIRYTASVIVHDTYNFDSIRTWNSFGNIMNNFAHIYHNLGGGNDFDWFAAYTHSTKWTDAT